MRGLRLLVLLCCAVSVPAQQLRLAPDSLVLRVGDTSRVTATLTGAPAGARVSFTGTRAAAFTAHRDGRVTARAPGCGYVRGGIVDSTWSRAQVRVCVLAATPLPTPVPTPPADTGLAFWSDWSHALGNSELAVKDGGRWPALTCIRTFPATLLVMRGDSVGFAGSNVLRVQMRGPTDCGMLQKNGAVPASTTHWGRFYIRNDDNGSKNDHPVAYHNIHGADDIQGVPMMRHANRLGFGRWQPGVVGDAPYPNNKWYGPALENGAWYRYEWQMEYVTATTVRIHPRIYSLDGTLLHTASSYVNDDGRTTLAGWYAAGGVIRLANGGRANAELARNFGMGNEGPGSSTATLGYWYYAKVALSTAGWIGR